MDDETVVFERHRVSYEEAFRAELHHFHAAVRQGQPAQPGIADALADARWIDAIAHALLRGTPASIGVHSVPTG
jgi:predicted dehydrogenase